MLVALNICMPIVEAIIPLLTLCFPHTIITERPLNLFDGFCLCVGEFLANFDANSLPNPLSHGGTKLECDEYRVHTNKHMRFNND